MEEPSMRVELLGVALLKTKHDLNGWIVVFVPVFEGSSLELQLAVHGDLGRVLLRIRVENVCV